MARTVFSRQVVEQPWTIVRLAPDESPAALALPESGGIFPVRVWLARRQEIIARYKRIGLRLSDAAEIEAIAGDLHYFQLIAIDIAGPFDGQVHAAARLLRERCRYRGEVRALCDIDAALPAQGPAIAVPLINLNANLRSTVARKVGEVESRLTEIARRAAPAVGASGLAARDLVLADIVAASGLPITLHAGAAETDLLADWSDREIWAYIHQHQVPYGAPAPTPVMRADNVPLPRLRLVQSCMARQ